MVLIKEYVEEYQVGQLFSVAEASKNETGGGEGIQVLKNEPYEKDEERGQYTHKVYHLASKVPKYLQMLAPGGSLVFHEEAWNAYPYCRTIVTVHKLDEATWKTVDVVPIDIADNSAVDSSGPISTQPEAWLQGLGRTASIDEFRRSVYEIHNTGRSRASWDYKTDEDPTMFQSVKTARGPLGPDWQNELVTKTDCPKMCAYKLVTVQFKWWGMQTKMENFIHKQETRIFTNFHRQLFCWIDKWVELTMADIRQMEAETQKELEELRNKGDIRGTSAAAE
ncbi:hypothetical protein NHX12_028270 [Muraenolepis orangiensis]|uniref:Phosphatidylinositol transfer protein beta isoform n=1 Tax=Muraenolepis orangiensis TaxID=630683 RepID=A0A9Q0EA97_9TELE|nr:hypothetical protein NHX12_028270 [Muraenolepis orangiensis]